MTDKKDNNNFKLRKITQMLNVFPEEQFRVEAKTEIFMFQEENKKTGIEPGLYKKSSTNKEFQKVDDSELLLILTGQLKILNNKYNPAQGTTFFTYRPNWSVGAYVMTDFEPSYFAMQALGMIFRTREEAIRCRPEIYEALTGLNFQAFLKSKNYPKNWIPKQNNQALIQMIKGEKEENSENKTNQQNQKQTQQPEQNNNQTKAEPTTEAQTTHDAKPDTDSNPEPKEAPKDDPKENSNEPVSLQPVSNQQDQPIEKSQEVTVKNSPNSLLEPEPEKEADSEFTIIDDVPKAVEETIEEINEEDIEEE